jgi:hypothetical protein
MKHYIECDPKEATHYAHPVHERNTIDLSEPSVKIKPFTPPSEEEIEDMKRFCYDLFLKALKEEDHQFDVIYAEGYADEVIEKTILSLLGGKNQE